MAVANYHDVYGCLPPAFIVDENGKRMHSWRVLLLPYLDENDLYQKYDFSEPWDGPNNRKILEHRPTSYAFHDAPKGTITNFVAVVGKETVWPNDTSLKLAQITDGHAGTILIAENVAANIPWTEPRDLEIATMDMRVGLDDVKGITSQYDPPAVATVDCCIRSLPMHLSPQTLKSLLTANGGETIVESGFVEIADGRDRPLKQE
jgi:5'-3' exonuclease